MMLVVVIGIGLLFILLFRYIHLKTQTNKLTRELKKIRQERSNERLQMTLANRTLEELAEEINNIFEEKQEVHGEAKRNEQEVTEMITNMSHDLRTPLTVMIGYIQLLDQSNLSKKDQARYVFIIHERANELHELIQGFFALSSLQNAEEALKFKPINLIDMVQTSFFAYYDSLEKNNQDVTFDLPKDNCMVIGDMTACKRIIENIILNVLQHGGENIEVKIETTKDNVSFIVQNTLKKNELLDENRLFDKLYTNDDTRREHRGFGLSIVDQLMKQMNGQVTALVERKSFMIRCTWPR